MTSALKPATTEPVPHVLLTVLGTRPSQALYALHGRSHEAILAPLALLSLLPPDQRPNAVVALCTPEASSDSLPYLREQLPAECTLTVVDVPSGHSQNDINTFLRRATEAVPHHDGLRSQLTLDVTHGFRHFAFLTYLAGLYLVSLRDVALLGAWYGLLRRDEESPFLDLRPLLELPRWIHALQVFAETGSALPMAEALDGQEAAPREASTMARELRAISEGYLSALPLELGRQVALFRSQRLRSLHKSLRDRYQLRLAAELVNQLDHLLQPFALQINAQGQGWKAKVPLTMEELQRQGRIIDALFSHGDAGMALGLLDEWTVTWAAWCMDQSQNWLKYFPQRRLAAGQLGALTAAAKDGVLKHLLTAQQQQIGNFWGLLSGLRNGYHHHGMRAEVLVGNPRVDRDLAGVKAFWDQTLRSCPRIGLAIGDGSAGLLLVSAMGHAPGVLSSALQACHAHAHRELSTCLVICSAQSEYAITEACAQANFHGDIVPLLLKDPYGGRTEIQHLVDQAQEHLVLAEEVYVNVTGGTTLMGLAVHALADAAGRLARPVQCFGLIDRRSPGEEVEEPYQVGEPFWLRDRNGEDQ